jgi:hypothetical protein
MACYYDHDWLRNIAEPVRWFQFRNRPKGKHGRRVTARERRATARHWKQEHRKRLKRRDAADAQRAARRAA